MATRTTELGLEKPGRGEFTNAWDTPMNTNSDKIDAFAAATRLEIQNARGSKATLTERLDEAMDSGGNLYATDEVIAARNSFLYGNIEARDVFAELNDKRDEEVWRAQQGTDSLLGGISYQKSFQKGSVLAGAKNINGEPAWVGSVANKIAIYGTSTPVYLEIAGKAARIRTLKEVTLGAAGLYFVYATWQEDGVKYREGTGSTTYVAGGTFPYQVSVLEDLTANFISLGVQPGDLLIITTTGGTKKYIIDADPISETQILIRGNFPYPPASYPYELRDPLDVVLGSNVDENAIPADSLIIAEGTSDGLAVTEYNARHFNDTYVGDWRPVDVGTLPNFEETWNHRLGSHNLAVEVQIKEATDSEFVETLSITKIGSSLATSVDLTPVSVNLTDSRTLTKGTLTTDSVSDGDPAHSHTISGSPAYSAGALTAALSGTPTSSLTGAVYPENSVAVKYSRNQIKVKNAVASKLYRDYDGVERTEGFIRVIITKRG